MSARQNFHHDCEVGLNKCINILLKTAYMNKCQAAFYQRDDIALPGFHSFFEALSKEHQHQADKLMTYQNKRGGRVELENIDEPDRQYWNSGATVMENTLCLEKNINQSLLTLAACGKASGDPQIVGFLKKKMLNKQVGNIKKVSDYISKLNQLDGGLGEYMFDQRTLQH